MNGQIIDFLVVHHYISDKSANVYAYGLVVLELFLLTNGSILILAAMLGKLWFGISYLLCFSLLRIVWGGYHASTPFRCYVSSLTLFFIEVMLFENLRCLSNISLFALLWMVAWYIKPALTRTLQRQQQNNRIKKWICLLYGFVYMFTNIWMRRLLCLALLINVCLRTIYELERINING